jgi:uncharacterized protein
MRVAILADTHGFLDPRIADVVSACDVAVHAGDVGGADVLLALQPREQVVAVKGNNDLPAKWAEHEVHVLETLPGEAVLDLPGGQLVVVHGNEEGPVAERHQRLRARYPNARAIAYGHSHQLLIDDSVEPWVLNPGAAGRTRTYGGPSCLLLECTADSWKIEEYRLPPRRYRAL